MKPSPDSLRTLLTIPLEGGEILSGYFVRHEPAAVVFDTDCGPRRVALISIPSDLRASLPSDPVTEQIAKTAAKIATVGRIVSEASEQCRDNEGALAELRAMLGAVKEENEELRAEKAALRAQNAELKRRLGETEL